MSCLAPMMQHLSWELHDLYLLPLAPPSLGSIHRHIILHAPHRIPLYKILYILYDSKAVKSYQAHERYSHMSHINTSRSCSSCLGDV